MFRICLPGGRVIIVTWCHRELLLGEDSLTRKEMNLLDKMFVIIVVFVFVVVGVAVVVAAVVVG